MEKATHKITCEKGHNAIFDNKDYSDYCQCGEKYKNLEKCCFSFLSSGVHSFNCPVRKIKIKIN